MERPKTNREHRPVLLFAFANDDRPGRRLEGLRREIEGVRRTLTPVEREGLCEVIVRESTTPGELVEVLEDPRYRRRLALIHFAGHASESRLLLEGIEGPVAARIKGLAPLLGELDGLTVLFLNGCATLEQGRRLVGAGIPVVIATESMVDDTMAQHFAVDFYRAVASGASVCNAFERACSQAKCFATDTRTARDLVPPTAPRGGASPWRLLTADSHEDAKDWSLPSAANDPLFGLPAPVGGMLPQEPFMGLRRFTARESTIFFGRGRAIRNLYQDVLDPEMPPVLVVYGASGVGKSSLIEAGLMPRLAAVHQTHELRLERKQDPEQMLRRALGDVGGHSDLAQLWCARERGCGRPVVVCIDQLEALVLDEGGRALARFIRALASLYERDRRPRGKLLLGLRKEWFPELRNELRRHRMAWHEHFVEPLGRDDVEEIVLGPTRTASMRARYGITCEDGLPERIADELSRDRESAIAPMLQILLTRMWERVEPKVTSVDGRVLRHFSMAVYDELRRDGLALSDFVDRQIEAIRSTHEEELSSGLVLDLLYRHTTSRGTAAVCTYSSLRASYAHQLRSMESLVERCISLYLLQPVANAEAGEDGVRLAHDTLAPIVRERHRRSKALGQAAARLLEARMGMAETSGRCRLLDEHDLEQVEAAQTGMRRWTQDEQQLVIKSRRWRRRAAWIRAGRRALVVCSLGGALAMFLLESIEPRSDAAVVRSMTSVTPSRAPKLAKGDGMGKGGMEQAGPHEVPSRGVEPEGGRGEDPLALEQREPEANARVDRRGRRGTGGGEVDRCTIERKPTGLTGSTAEVETMAVSGDGSRVALGMGERNKALVFEPSRDGVGDLLEITTPRPVNIVEWSPDGQSLGIGEESGVVQVVRWGKGGREPTLDCDGHSNSVRALRFSADGSLVVTGDRDGTVVIHDSRTCTRMGSISLGGGVEALAEGEGKAWIAAGSGGWWRTWVGADDGTASPQSQLSGGVVIRHASPWSPDRWLVSAGHHLYSWDSSSTAPRRSHGESSLTSYWMIAAEREDEVLTATRQAVDLWSWESGEWMLADTVAVPSGVAGLAATADRRDLFVADDAGDVHWLEHRRGSLASLGRFDVSSRALSAIVVDPRLRYFAVGDHGGDVMLTMLPPRGAAIACMTKRIDPTMNAGQ